MNQNNFFVVLKGFIGTIALLILYLTIVSLISGFEFARSQFSQFWYYIVSLALGFGIQIGLYSFLKNLIQKKDSSGRVLYVSGTTSTLAMISCCAHYLANILPIIGVSVALSIISQYQVKLFWVGLVFNLAGIVFILSRIFKLPKERVANL